MTRNDIAVLTKMLRGPQARGRVGVPSAIDANVMRPGSGRIGGVVANTVARKVAGVVARAARRAQKLRIEVRAAFGRCASL